MHTMLDWPSRIKTWTGFFTFAALPSGRVNGLSAVEAAQAAAVMKKETQPVSRWTGRSIRPRLRSSEDGPFIILSFT